jgi:hypothetical protein
MNVKQCVNQNNYKGLFEMIDYFLLIEIHYLSIEGQGIFLRNTCYYLGLDARCVFDCCKQYLTRLSLPSIHPPTHPPTQQAF